MGTMVNPYIAGAPITEARMFFGREDIFQWIENSIAGQYADHILVLHGQRRVGKTSVLKQLGNRLPERFIPVFFDLQGRTHTTLDRFLWWLAREIVRVLKQEHAIELALPEKEAFASDSEYFEHRFLPDLQPALGNRTLLLTFDEFDNLEESEIKEELARPLIDYLRQLIGNTGLNFIFSIGSAGRKLENMQAAYTEFFKTALYKKISFLDKDQTRSLVTRPVESIIEYDPQAITRIYQVTGGHPYFTQLTCHELFAECQRTDKRYIHEPDVESILEDVIERGTVNLKFVWDEASDIEKWGLTALAHLEKTDNRTLADFLRKQRVRFSEADLTSGLLHLREKDILTRENNFVIHLMKLWLQKNRPIEQAREELTEVNPIANRYIEIGLEFKNAGVYAKAIESFQEALEVAKDNIQAQVNIGLTYMDQGLYSKAVVEFNKALTMDDEEVAARAGLCNAHLALGDAALQEGRTEEAIQAYQRVLGINSEHTEARQRLAQINREPPEKPSEKGRLQKAIEQLAATWKHLPDNQTSTVQQSDLNEKKANRDLTSQTALSNETVQTILVMDNTLQGLGTQPVTSNPYIYGSPVTDPTMFYGRKDIFDWISANLIHRDEDRILAIYGQRRIGKTSILKQLRHHLPDNYIPLFFDMQGKSRTTFDSFSWRLAREIARTLNDKHNLEIAFPDLNAFQSDPLCFETQFLPPLLLALKNKTLFTIFDEFDALEMPGAKEYLAHPLLDFLQRLIKHAEIDFIFSLGMPPHSAVDQFETFAGFFKGALCKKIDVLPENQTYDLITRPAAEILEYDEDAVQYIIEITNCHPYFTQLICHELFSRFQGAQISRIHKENVDEILENASEHGSANLNFVWNEASSQEKLCLAALAQMDEQLNDYALLNYLRQRGIHAEAADLLSSLKRLKEKDVLSPRNEFRIKLFKKWLQQNHHPQQVFQDVTMGIQTTDNYISQGLVLMENGQYEQAADSFKEVLDFDTNHIEAHLNLGYAYFDLGRLDDAEREFNIVKTIDNANKRAQVGLRQVTDKRLLESFEDEKANRLRVFLCHSSLDKPAAHELYKRLCMDGFDPWLDKEKLIPGQDWDQEIQKAVRISDAVIVLISHNSVSQQGYIQKEIRFALDIADQQPENTIFLIPMRLEENEVPNRLARWQWVDYFEDGGYDKLLLALHKRAMDKGTSVSPHKR